MFRKNFIRFVWTIFVASAILVVAAAIRQNNGLNSDLIESQTDKPDLGNGEFIILESLGAYILPKIIQ
ncbi:MAG: hypothetical protein K2P88_02365 [Chitinophagaceae bacterium]|jgi:hypothetical protein|uniref:hypothetical protein n=1 Tax=unclassified Paraflavitalea TaxID=2798305 RepID=UPI003D3293F1|nr:hypothetical protein [Chitinophagaceae bacterium]